MKMSERVVTMMLHTAPRPVVVALGSLLLAAAAAVQAQSLAQCRALADAPARLACYDALPGPAVAAPAAAAAARKETAPAPVREAAVAAAPVAPAPAAATADFGLQKPPPQVEDIRSSLPGAFTGWGPRSRLRLANGQLWEIADGSRVVYTLDSPGVRVVRGMFGAFYLEVDGVNQRPRVRRIE